MNKILLLEDDASLTDGLSYFLKKNGFAVEIVRTAGEALQLLPAIEEYDLLLLDVTLPDGTGFAVCERIRDSSCRVPIIFLTASDEEVNIIRGLDCGGDDYITKPFRIGELCSRIRALLRRAKLSGSNPRQTLPQVHPYQQTASIVCGNLTIDPVGGRISLDGKALDLTNAEYRLLCLLARNANRVIPRNMILDKLWDSAGDFVDDNTLSVYVRRLREKIEADPSHPKHLVTVRGFGYQWKEVSE